MKLRRKQKKGFIFFFVILFLLFALIQAKGEEQRALSKKEMISIFGGEECTEQCKSYEDCAIALEMAHCVGTACDGNDCIACVSGGRKRMKCDGPMGSDSCQEETVSCGAPKDGGCYPIMGVACTCVEGMGETGSGSCGNTTGC